MHSSTLAARETREGWVIDATKADGRIEQLLGLFTSKSAATDWIADHPAEWWTFQAVNEDLGGPLFYR